VPRRGDVENWAFLARDADLLEQLSSSQRVKAEGVLTSFEIESMEPERFHTQAVVDLVRGLISADEFTATVAAARAGTHGSA